MNSPQKIYIEVLIIIYNPMDVYAIITNKTCKRENG